MATPPDFSVGQVLTSAQMNAVGLWKMIPTSATTTGAGSSATVDADGNVTIVGNAATLTINACFTSDYRCYKILIQGIDCSTGFGNLFQLQMANTNNHIGSMYSDLYTGGISAFYRNNVVNVANIGFCSPDTDLNITFDIINPQLAQRTSWHGFSYTAGLANWFSGQYNLTTQFTNITFVAAAGTFTGGRISILGYNT
jgi:hypothetical protein